MLRYKIGLTLLPKVGSKLGKELVSYCGGAEAVFKEKQHALLKIPGIGTETAKAILGQQVLGRADKEVQFLERNQIKPLFYLDKDYPARLKHCQDAPLMLYYKGRANLNAAKIIAIVGTRHATQYGKAQCEQLIRDLTAENDLVIVSGLAYGVDSCAHRVAVENDLPTVGVMGRGLDGIYPDANRSLALSMLEKGGWLSEFISGTKPDRENFPQRNRVIAGLSDAVVVVESGRKGGAVITADIANSYNRDVFAFPGRVGDAYSEGCNNLIKTNKAALIESSKDLYYIMGWDEAKQPVQRNLFVDLSPTEELIVEVLRKQGPVVIDDLILSTHLKSSDLTPLLLNLEFQGVLKCLPGKVYALI